MKPETFYKNYYPTFTKKLQEFLTKYANTLKARGTVNIKQFTEPYTDATKSFITNPGKYLRPYSAFITYVALNKLVFTEKQNTRAKQAPPLVKKPKEIINTTALLIGTYLELIHDHLLIHDDIMDKSIKRRQQPTVWKALHNKIKNRHNAYSLGILAGNQALLMAFKLLAYLKPFNKQALQNVIQTTYEYIEKVIQGQIADIMLPTIDINQVSQEDILWIYKNKTAIYTTIMPVAIVSSMFNAPLLNDKNFLRALDLLGISFQIIDDLKDFLPGSKTRYTDIQERKYTLLVLHALKNIGSKHKKYLNTIYSSTNRLTNKELNKIALILLKYAYKDNVSFLTALLNNAEKLSRNLPSRQKFIFNNQLYVINLYKDKIANQLNSIYKTIK